MDLLNLSPAAAPASGARAVTTEGFEREVLQKSMTKPVIVDFWATWCGPCRQLLPALEAAVAEAKGAVDLVKVDIDQNQDLAHIFRVQSVPTVYAFFHGQPVDGFMGAKPASDLKAFVARLVQMAGAAAPAEETPSPSEGAADPARAKTLIEEGDALFRDGKTDAAMEKYATALDADPAAHAALGAIGWCLAAQGQMDAVREILAQAAAENRDDARVKGLEMLFAPAEDGAGTGPMDKIYAAALDRISLGALQDGIDALVDLIRRDREWADQKARKRLLALFDAMGPWHPLTSAGRRKLSTVLFS